MTQCQLEQKVTREQFQEESNRSIKIEWQCGEGGGQRIIESGCLCFLTGVTLSG